MLDRRCTTFGRRHSGLLPPLTPAPPPPPPLLHRPLCWRRPCVPTLHPTGLAPPLKRKKTVTWAEDDELELPLGPPGGAEEGAGAAATAAPVVVLPCDGLYDALTADLLEQQGAWSAAPSWEWPVCLRGGPCCIAFASPVPCQAVVISRWLPATHPAAPAPQWTTPAPLCQPLTLLHPPCCVHAEELPAAAGEEPLSRRQLLERRLAHTDQLAALYEGELWALAEELRLRHTQFVAQRGEQAVWKGGEGGTPAGSEAQQQQRTYEDTEMADADDQPAAQQQQQAESAAKPSAGEESAAPGAALRALWQERQQVQQGAGDAAQQDEQEQGSEQDVKQPQQGAGLQQAGGKPEGKAGKKGAKAAAAGDKAAAKRGGQAAGKEGSGKAAKAVGKQEAAQDKQQADAEGASKQTAKQTAAKQASVKDAPISDSAGQQPAAAGQPGQEGAAAAGAPAEPAAPAVQLPPLPPQPRFEDIEALVLSGAAAGLPPVDEAALVEARARFVRRLDLLGRLEQSALSAAARQLDVLGGLALLCGRRCRYILRRSAVAIGRSSGSQGKVRGVPGRAGRWALGIGSISRGLAWVLRLRCAWVAAQACPGRSTKHRPLPPPATCGSARHSRFCGGLRAFACQPDLPTCLPALHGSKVCALAHSEASPACLLTLLPPSGGCGPRARGRRGGAARVAAPGAAVAGARRRLPPALHGAAAHVGQRPAAGAGAGGGAAHAEPRGGGRRLAAVCGKCGSGTARCGPCRCPACAVVVHLKGAASGACASCLGQATAPLILYVCTAASPRSASCT